MKIKKAGSSELDRKCFPVVGLIEEWSKNGKIVKGTSTKLGGTMRLGLYPAKLQHNSQIKDIYNELEHMHDNRKKIESATNYL
mgnify:CR=1 FL=1